MMHTIINNITKEQFDAICFLLEKETNNKDNKDKDKSSNEFRLKLMSLLYELGVAIVDSSYYIIN